MIEKLCHKISTDNLDENTDKTDEIMNKILIDWIQEQAKENKFDYLLAHAEDGVIWGKFENGKLMTSNQAFPNEALPELRLETLQQCRIFGEKGEVLLWQTDRGWYARLIQDNSNFEYIPEEQILWGTKKDKELNGFTFLTDGSEGLKHAVPLTGITFKNDSENLYRPLRLLIHHYIDYDDSGIAKIVLSRLVSLKQNTLGNK
ncbi:MAG: TIGR03984 family CRISPR-associated protein [Okeania sp. SIO3I5]|uniref:type III-D CRISPR-associated protein Csx19 n=1 Tax=Okeania sp. SIO3I5 TaxID=2607805 RepID=UPI0013BC60E1|nr:CRISPR-associated protein Csx19 [Okeania sp. SIO3I5]NEQ36903.1 TIGR03984 family CRISPR-associated protein [Okeania sp. SIO3I5]